MSKHSIYNEQGSYSIPSKCHFCPDLCVRLLIPSWPYPSQLISIPFDLISFMDSSLEHDIIKDMEAWFTAKGQSLSEHTCIYPRNYHYWVYVPILQVGLFMANHFEQDNTYRFPPCQGYQLMVTKIPYQTTKSGFIKRIWKFYPGHDFLIPTQHLNDKKWNRNNKHWKIIYYFLDFRNKAYAVR